MSYPKTAIIVCCNLLPWNSYSQGQITKDNSSLNSSYWLCLGIGKSYFGPTFNFGFSYSFDGNILAVRYLKGDEFRYNIEGQYDDPQLRFKEFGVLYGRLFRKDYVALSVSLGLGFMDGVDRGEQITYRKYEQISISTFSIPMEAKFRSELSNHLGIGVSYFGNLNVKRSLSGGMLDFYVGVF